MSILLPADSFWIIASDTSHIPRMAFLCRKQKKNASVLLFYVLRDLVRWITSGTSTPTAPSDGVGRKQDRPSKESAFSMSSSCCSNSRISQHSFPQPGEYRGILAGRTGMGERQRRGGMEIQGEGPEKYDDSFVISLSSCNLQKRLFLGS